MAEFLISIVPSAGAVLLFWLVLRAILQADRRERAAVARFDAEREREAADAGGEGAAGAPDGGTTVGGAADDEAGRRA